jgi:hypothetical protein
MLTATLNGVDETPSIATNAVGTAWAMLSSDKKTLYYQITYAQLSSAFLASYFFLGLPGDSGSVLQKIQFSGNTASGSWTNLSNSIVGDLVSGQVYVNVNSVKNPNGEICGQLSLVDGLGFNISLNENRTGLNSDTSIASGTGWAVLYNNGSSLLYNITIAGLTGSLISAQFQSGGGGSNGITEQPVTFTDSTTGGTWQNLTNLELDNLIHNNLFINILTDKFPGGEISGQVIRTGLIGFNASLYGSRETPPDTSTGSGTVWAVLDNNLSFLTYQLTYAQLTSRFSGAYFQLGTANVNGGEIESITQYTGNTVSGIWNLPDSDIINLIKGNVYLNINSIGNPNGEIRGQLLMNKGVGFSANLNINQDVPPTIQSHATGTAWLVLADDTLKFQITFAGLAGSYFEAHIHDGEPGVNGPLVHVLDFTDSTLNSYFTEINDTTMGDLIKDWLYINIHTSAYINGEIRGQIIQMAPGNSITGIQNNREAIPEQFILFQNYPNPFNPSTVISWQLTEDSNVKLKIYDILGREVITLVDEFQNAGSHSFSFNAEQIENHMQLTSGVYFYRLQAGGFISTKKMIYMK